MLKFAPIMPAFCFYFANKFAGKINASLLWAISWYIVHPARVIVIQWRNFLSLRVYALNIEYYFGGLISALVHYDGYVALLHG